MNESILYTHFVFARAISMQVCRDAAHELCAEFKVGRDELLFCAGVGREPLALVPQVDKRDQLSLTWYSRNAECYDSYEEVCPLTATGTPLRTKNHGFEVSTPQLRRAIEHLNPDARPRRGRAVSDEVLSRDSYSRYLALIYETERHARKLRRAWAALLALQPHLKALAEVSRAVNPTLERFGTLDDEGTHQPADSGSV